MKQAKIQICLFIVLLAGLTGCGSTAKKAEVTNSPEPMFLFTLWLLFSGISRFVSAFDLKALGVHNWGWVLAVGIVLMIAGFICMMDPLVSITAVGMTVGLVFLLEGISAIVYACIPRTR